jgi:hypothetical protein
MVWSVVPVAFVAYSLYRPSEAFKRWFVICFLSFIPYAILMIRAALVGLTLVPATFRGAPDKVPAGVLSFYRVAAVSQWATATLLWDVSGRYYGDLDPSSVFLMRDFAGYSTLIEDLRSLPDGEPVPNEIDTAFSEAARRLSDDGGIQYRIGITALRMYHLWVDEDRVFNWFYLGNAKLYQYLREIAEYERSFYLLLLVLCLALTKSGMYRILLAGVLVMVLSRTVFLAFLTALEIRYLIPVLPPMQFVAIALWSMTSDPSRLESKSPQTNSLVEWFRPTPPPGRACS